MSTSSAPGRFDWPWRGGPSFVTPDGSQVSLRGSMANGVPLDLSKPWSCGFIASVRGVRRAFTVAETGAFDWHSTFTTIPDEIHREPYRGGELLLGIQNSVHNQSPGEYRAAWRGQWFELHTRGSGPPPRDGITQLFDPLRLTDTPLGMLVAPRSTRQAQLEPVRVDKQITGIGYLTIERPTARQFLIPEHRGYATRYGELWRQPLGTEARGRARSDALVLATPTAVAQLIAGPYDNPDPDDALAFLTDLDVVWELL